MHVLLVGKDPLVLGMYKDLLEEFGMEVSTTVEEAYRPEDYDVVAYLWPMSVFQLGRQLRAATVPQRLDAEYKPPRLE